MERGLDNGAPPRRVDRHAKAWAVIADYSGEGGAFVHHAEAFRLASARQEGFGEWEPALHEGGAAARLVPSKTTQGAAMKAGESRLISFGKSELAEKRVARLKRSVWASGHLHGLAEKGHRPAVAWFVTLTYAEADAWEPMHIGKGFEGYRQWCRRAGVECRYTWVAEIQPKRCERTGKAVVHYHALAWLPPGVDMPSWARKPSRRHAAFWPHGRTESEIARSGVGYLMKYLSKLGEFHRFPKGLRLYGIGGLNTDGRQVRSWFNLPEWAKRLHGVGEVSRSFGRLVVRATGEILQSPYSVSPVPGGLLVRLCRELPTRFHDGAYSSCDRRMNPC